MYDSHTLEPESQYIDLYAVIYISSTAIIILLLSVVPNRSMVALCRYTQIRTYILIDDFVFVIQ